MNFGRWFGKSTEGCSVCLAIFTDEVALLYQNSEQQWCADTYILEKKEQLESALIALIEKHHLHKQNLKLALGHGLFKTLLIDKPDVPEQEWPTVLPFLVKDLLNESPMEILADAFPAATKDRLQVFVANKRQVETMVQACALKGCKVISIGVEDVLWGQFSNLEANQLIVHCRQNEGLALSAFKQQVLCFQRQLRGFSTPIVASNNEQIDNLTLELQRSLDFLSTQFRGSTISKIMVACDGDDNSVLAQQLKANFNLLVEPIVDPDPIIKTNSLRLAWAMLTQHLPVSIELYREEFRPKKEWLTLTNVVLGWTISAVLLAAIWGWSAWSNKLAQEQLALQQEKLDAEQAKIEAIKAELALKIPSPAKVTFESELEQKIAKTQATLKAIANHDDSLKVGYSSMLQQLADAANGNIQLLNIHVEGKNLNLSGIARQPSSVPQWLKEFGQYSSLNQRQFESMKLGRNEQKQVTFSLTAKREEKVNP
ncbi:TPA: PilN domain-containing protein [Photobacterium damselae]